jgi:hypothetical protein
MGVTDPNEVSDPSGVSDLNDGVSDPNGGPLFMGGPGVFKGVCRSLGLGKVDVRNKAG